MPDHVNELRDAGPTPFVVRTQFLATRLFALSSRLRRKLANVGEIADYVTWGRERFPGFAPVASREELWELMARRLGPAPVRGFEFGVAWGYGTGWWLSRLRDDRLRWDGFDRFTGLPRQWRNLDRGHFDADGLPPALDDPRVRWHVGDVEDRIADLDLTRSEGEQFLVIFDLDVFEPSACAWEHLRDSLRPGDVLYFDEAFDRDERHLLDHLVLPAGRFDLIGATPMALALAVVELHPRP